MIVYFARHGESVANTGHVISNRDLDHPLTPTGRQQAVLLAEKLNAAGLTIIYSSPIPRALETATIVSRELNLPLETADGLREFDCGVLEGRRGPFAWMRFSWILRHWFERGNTGKSFPKGESFNDVQQRFLALMDELVARHASDGSSILCVTHAGAMHIGLTGLLSDQPYEQVISWSIPHTGIIKTIRENGVFTCASLDGVTTRRSK